MAFANCTHLFKGYIIMNKIALLIFVIISFSIVAPVYAGGAKNTHPCYDVADCKTEASKKEFSQCIKKNKEVANANLECAAFRKDKPAYMSNHGISGVDALFN